MFAQTLYNESTTLCNIYEMSKEKSVGSLHGILCMWFGNTCSIDTEAGGEAACCREQLGDVMSTYLGW